MPAEIAVNSTVEKIQNSTVLPKGYKPGQKCLIKHTITIILTCTFRRLSVIIIAATKTRTSINSSTFMLIKIRRFYPTYKKLPKHRTCRTLIPASVAATTA